MKESNYRSDHHLNIQANELPRSGNFLKLVLKIRIVFILVFLNLLFDFYHVLLPALYGNEIDLH